MDPLVVLRSLAEVTVSQWLVAVAAGAMTVVLVRHAAEGLGLVGDWGGDVPQPRALVASVSALMLAASLATVGLITATLCGLVRPPPA